MKQLLSSLHRSTIAASALMIAFAMMLGTSIMIDSFRKTVDYWIEQTVRADIYIVPTANMVVRSSEYIPENIVKQITSIPGVIDMDSHHEMWVESPIPDRAGLHRKIKISSSSFEVIEKHRHFLFKGRAPTSLSEMKNKNEVLINESFANHFQKKIGDRVSIPTPSGVIAFEIKGVFYDYSTDSGQILLDWTRYIALWNDPHVYSLALYLEPQWDAQVIKNEIEKRFAKNNHLAVFSNRDLRTEILRIFDQTFAVTLGLRLIAVIVAAVGMFFTLTALISERSREWAIIRSLGVTHKGLYGIAWAESCAIALVGWISSCVAGLGIAWLLAFVINKAYYGWTIQWYLDPKVFLSAFGLALLAAALACLLALSRQLRIPLSEALRYE